MPIEVDQSNKIERTERDTVLALSNDEQRAIVIPAQVKREAIQRLREQKSGKMIYLHLFAAGLFILLRPCLQRLGESVQPITVISSTKATRTRSKACSYATFTQPGFDCQKRRWVSPAWEKVRMHTE